MVGAIKKPMSFRLDPVTVPRMEEIAQATGRSTTREIEDALELAYELFRASKSGDENLSKYAVQRYTDALKRRMENTAKEN